MFSNLIRWSYDDAVIHLTQVFNFTDDECSLLIHQYPILSTSTTGVITMTAPNYNATTPKDVTDLTANLWQASKLLVDAKKLISATALTPGDYDSQDDFEDAVLQRLKLLKIFY